MLIDMPINVLIEFLLTYNVVDNQSDVVTYLLLKGLVEVLINMPINVLVKFLLIDNVVDN